MKEENKTILVSVVIALAISLSVIFFIEKASEPKETLAVCATELSNGEAHIYITTFHMVDAPCANGAVVFRIPVESKGVYYQSVSTTTKK